LNLPRPEPSALDQAARMIEAQVQQMSVWNDPRSLYLNCDCSVR